MRDGRGRRRGVKGVAAAILVCCVWGWIGSDTRGDTQRLRLVMYGMGNGRLIGEPVRIGQKVTVVYNHSVERVPVLEVYDIRGEGELYLWELISREPLLAYPGYEQYYSRMLRWDGKGEGPLPVDLDMAQRDWFMVKGMGRAKVMPLGVGGEFVDHRILVGSKVIRLRELAAPGDIVRLVVESEK